MASIAQLVGPAIIIAKHNGMTEEEGLSIANEVHALLHESLATEGDSPADERLVDLMSTGIFTEAHKDLHLDLAFIGLMAERGYLKTVG